MQNDKAVLAQWAKNLLNDDFFKEVIDNLKKEQFIEETNEVVNHNFEVLKNSHNNIQTNFWEKLV